jgi:hypothetical protein
MSLKFFPDKIIGHYNLREKALMAMYTWKFGAACTVYQKPASWQTSFIANSWDDMATLKCNTHTVFRNMSPGPSGLICALTIFGVKYIGDKNLKHLFSVLRTEMYKVV